MHTNTCLHQVEPMHNTQQWMLGPEEQHITGIMSFQDRQPLQMVLVHNHPDSCDSGPGLASKSCALRQSYGSAARSLGGLEGALGRAQVAAAAAAHCLRVARRDLRAVADTIDIVTACRLLPDIRVQL
ncbi:hypothetical protein BTVI_98286 [Pitangus sulphuratus]|nr:hypothetical protein BTVI_98286 [Pitangus sulphuratus]